ncbi:sugar phosphate isomerase/epimerase family protein [Qingshengfaniella alkalisoli]|uniref:Sugar phosphate isomerase/epimerase n=1 Tax=Qingshengfaniella alkalisoli TaxID=2599296 RepID=A0A5B8J843_9RHOB|nr:sugar phosphate isomerase/epimerase [Qingshengfaniella alkalisoli]QDY70430.1 sugar phosphate isomerase/epimerase [Qingshengfaniella alkalisoli]
MSYKISYQLYSSRNFPPLKDQLSVLKAMGYDGVEPWLPAYEEGAETLRQQIDDAGLACYGFHMPLDGLVNEPAKYVEIAQALGATYMIPPFVPAEQRQDTTEFWQRIGEQLATGADYVSKHGLKVVWHNHDFEYAALPDGTRPIEHILGQSDDVLFEIDCGWITRAGADPVAELERYADRIAAIQPKDTAPPGTEKDDGWAPTGDGIIDWPRLAPLFKETSAHHIVTEHDNPSDWKEFAQRSITYLKSLGL